MKRTAFMAAALLMCSDRAFSGTGDLEGVTREAINSTGVTAPAKPRPADPTAPPKVAIAIYVTSETFSFESEAASALDARITALQAAGITTLGGRVVPNGNDYSFVVDYIPTVKAGAQLPPAAIIETYTNGAAYWREADAQAAMNFAAAGLKGAQIPVLGAYLFPAGNDASFAVDYVNRNLLKPTPEYNVSFGDYQGGNFTFESEAVKSIGTYRALFKNAGIPFIRGEAVQKPDGNYAVRVEYAVRTNKYGARPQFAATRYESREVFAFDAEALKASKERMGIFTRAGVPPLSGIVRPEGGDYSFGIDFLVHNIYQQGGVIPSVSVASYHAPETFAFESEAKQAMREKAAAFEAAGLPVVGSEITDSVDGFAYTLEYLAKAAAPAPQHSRWPANTAAPSP